MPSRENRILALRFEQDFGRVFRLRRDVTEQRRRGVEVDTFEGFDIFLHDRFERFLAQRFPGRQFCLFREDLRHGRGILEVIRAAAAPIGNVRQQLAIGAVSDRDR